MNRVAASVASGGVRLLLGAFVGVTTAAVVLWLEEWLVVRQDFGGDAISFTTLTAFVIAASLALVVGGAVALGCDRIFVSARARSRRLGGRTTQGR